MLPILNTISDPFTSDLFKSEDLPGEFLVQPLKVYIHFFAKSTANSSGIKETAWVITFLVSLFFLCSHSMH